MFVRLGGSSGRAVVQDTGPVSSKGGRRTSDACPSLAAVEEDEIEEREEADATPAMALSCPDC